MLGLDVFDNLPRDKVYRDDGGLLYAAVVHDDGTHMGPEETFVQVSTRGADASSQTDGSVDDDALIAQTVRCVRAWVCVPARTYHQR